MPTYARNTDGNKGRRTGLYFPDRAEFDTIEEYDEKVRLYWDAVDAYRDMATELHKDIMKGKDCTQSKDEKRPNQKG